MTIFAASAVLDSYWKFNRAHTTLGEHRKKLHRVSAGAAVGTVALNIFAEKVGYGGLSTPDVWDFV